MRVLPSREMRHPVRRLRRRQRRLGSGGSGGVCVVLCRALQQLPVDQREALILVCATGLSYEEAADVCQVAVGTIKSRIHFARKLLKKQITR